MLKLLQPVITLGQRAVKITRRVGQSGVFMSQVLLCAFKPWRAFPFLVEQLYFVGVLSLIIVITSGLFIGMVVALQGHHTLVQFGAEQNLGQLLALSVVRELGPVVTALLFAGRAGTALTAELALMRATEQIASMELMAVDPLWRVVSPRFWAGLISLPVLAVIFSAVAIMGGYLVGVWWLGVDAGSFWSNMQSAVHFRADIINGVIKTVAFGLACTWVAIYQGYYAVPNAEGMGRATTRTVVYASLLVLALDFILTAVMLGDW